jgi:TPR repeat protein/nucleoside-triphosphatase THEP1/DNA-binding Lrp family transcriptional regulator
MLPTKRISYIYNPANQTPQELIDGFVIRTEEFKKIFHDIKTSTMQNPEQHYIVQGPRGSGKTTLLLRLAYEIERDKKLSQSLLTVRFNEEQYDVRRLERLWEKVIDYLDNEKYPEFKGLNDKREELEYNDEYEERCLSLLLEALRANKKKVILFIDNIGDMLDKFKERDQNRFRETLLTCPDIRIIGASARMLEHTYDYGKPFFEFFKIVQLKGLNKKETINLLRALGSLHNTKSMDEIIAKAPGRIETLRRLTGGIPRTIVLLFEIFLDDSNGDSILDLEKILDRVTPFYKERMDDLSPQQQDIMDFMALTWDGVSTREISERTRIESKAVSSQLQELEKYGLIHTIETRSKNNLYQLSERFFNIWYLMRNGSRKEKNRVKWLVRFFECWFNEQDIIERAKRHLEALTSRICEPKYMVYVTEALAQTGKLPLDLEQELYDGTRSYITMTSDQTLLEELSPTDKEIIENVEKYLKDNDIETAIKKTNEIKSGSGIKDSILGDIHRKHMKDFQGAEKHYLVAAEKGHASAMYNVALFYKSQYQDYKSAEKYYLMAVAKGHEKAMYNLAHLYDEQYKDYKSAEKYYLMAIEKGHASAMYNLALLYKNQYRDYKSAEKYYLMAVAKEHDRAMFNLAHLYDEQYKDYKNAEKYYLMAVAKEHARAMFNLALLYMNQYHDYESAEKYYTMAADKEHVGAMNNLVMLYFDRRINKDSALQFAQKLFNLNYNPDKVPPIVLILVWTNNVERAIEIFTDKVSAINIDENVDRISDVFIHLIAKKQYHQTLKYFNDQEFEHLHLKDKFKPVYYALMHYMRDEYPNEYLKMGEELKETVEEIIQKIEKVRIDYA